MWLRVPEKCRLGKVVAAATTLSSSPVCFSCFLFYKNTCICPLLSGTAGYAGAYLAYPVDPPLLTPMASGDQPPTTSMEPERCELDPNDGSYLYSGCSLSIFSWMKCQQRATRHNLAVGIETSTSLTLLLAMML